MSGESVMDYEELAHDKLSPYRIIQQVNVSYGCVVFICNHSTITIGSFTFNFRTGIDYNWMIGKTFMNFSYYTPVLDDEEKYKFRIQFDDGTEFKFYEESHHEIYLNVNYHVETKKNALIILVGLPGCGKSDYGKMLQTDMKNSVFYDDDREDIITKDIVYDLLQNKRVIVASNMLCYQVVYESFISEMCLEDEDRSVITYCFEPNLECSLNYAKNNGISSDLIEILHNDYIDTRENKIYKKCRKIRAH